MSRDIVDKDCLLNNQTISIGVKSIILPENLESEGCKSYQHYTIDFEEESWIDVLDYFLTILNNAGYIIDDKRRGAIINAAEEGYFYGGI